MYLKSNQVDDLVQIPIDNKELITIKRSITAPQLITCPLMVYNSNNL